MGADDTADMVSKALRRAWQLGQTYWQQADSESYSQNKRPDTTQAIFDKLVEDTRAALIQKPLTECSDNDSPWLVCKPCAADGKCKNATLDKGLTVQLGADGVWLAFAASTGRHALLNVERIADSHGGIVSKALRDWAADFAKATGEAP